MDARDILELAWVVPALPLLGALILLLVGGRFLKEPAAGILATLMMAAAFAWGVVQFAALLSLDGSERQVVHRLFTWIPAGSLEVTASTLVDPLSITMVLFVSGVGTLIHLYSIGYMHGDPRFSRFFLYLNLFAASMLILVLGGSFPLTFVGWEGVGLCSYLLISFWFERPAAAVAGKKAFVTNRIGDFGFLLAMFLMFTHLGTLEILPALEGATHLASGTATAIALLLFVGAAGKSAQLPLHVWLPDAMEGPTPVSALIHAATMVTAGVYLVVRAHPFFEASSAAATTVAWVGAGTALVAATIALVHNDIKRVLAYSTISQLGYMFLAAGIGAYVAAIFHMVTHAFFKALLFLGSGSVMHGMNDEQDMRRMGGLRKYMPVTAATFIVAWLAIAGIVPLAGFWSKDEILASAWVDGKYALWAVGAVTALLTGFYMTRQVFMVFFGPERWRDPAPSRETVTVGAASMEAVAGEGAVEDAAMAPAESQADPHVTDPTERLDPPHAHTPAEHPHESPAVMLFPLVVLAGLSAIGGLLNLPFEGLKFLTDWLHPIFHGVEEPHVDSFGLGFALSTVAVIVAVVGILAARSLYRDMRGDDPAARRMGGASTFFERGWYFDRIYEKGIVAPGRRALVFLRDGVDLGIVDGAVNGVARLLNVGGEETRRVQSGYVRRYAIVLFAGTVALVLYVLSRSTLG
ncbi:MAG TPA: NADH-quinone oxidoreductase subunit L [Acidimicrobiia bacterium]|nr:NADH-quinone oxidoreductase subunit L [Acidimicrobiia bacterium]